MAGATPESSMEDILASIRRIIVDNGGRGSAPAGREATSPPVGVTPPSMPRAVADTPEALRPSQVPAEPSPVQPGETDGPESAPVSPAQGATPQAPESQAPESKAPEPAENAPAEDGAATPASSAGKADMRLLVRRAADLLGPLARVAGATAGEAVGATRAAGDEGRREVPPEAPSSQLLRRVAGEARRETPKLAFALHGGSAAPPPEQDPLDEAIAEIRGERRAASGAPGEAPRAEAAETSAEAEEAPTDIEEASAAVEEALSGAEPSETVPGAGERVPEPGHGGDEPEQRGAAAGDPTGDPAIGDPPAALAAAAQGATLEVPAVGAMEEPLLSEPTRASVAAAFQSLADSVLAREADDLRSMVREMLRPMLKMWLDENMPRLVENLVRAEIERITRNSR